MNGEVNNKRRIARESLDELRYSDIARLCDIFGLTKIGGRERRISRLLKEDSNLDRIVRFSRLILLGYAAEFLVQKKVLKEMLSRSRLPTGGNWRKLYMTLVENQKLPVSEFLDKIGVRGIKEIYEVIFDEAPVDSEEILKERIIQWLDIGNMRERPVAASQSLSQSLDVFRSAFPVGQLPDELERVVNEIEACMKCGAFTAAAVMIRKAVEVAIYLKFEQRGISQGLLTDKGDTLAFDEKLARATANGFLSPQKRSELKQVKWFGDSGAHSFKVVVKEGDAVLNLNLLRLCLQELDLTTKSKQ